MGDNTLIIEMIEMFLNSSPEVLDNMQQYLDNEDFKELEAEAHKFKPTLSYMGMDRTKDLVEEIETEARNEGDRGILNQKMVEVQSMCKQAYKELSEILTDLKQS